jgi:hypothetical protein
MSWAWLTDPDVGRWAGFALSFLAGLFAGRLLFSGARREAGRDVAPAGEPGSEEPSAPSGAARSRVEALEKEVREARTQFLEKDEEADVFEDQITMLDSALKRANGRLKLVLRLLRRGDSR